MRSQQVHFIVLLSLGFQGVSWNSYVPSQSIALFVYMAEPLSLTISSTGTSFYFYNQSYISNMNACRQQALAIIFMNSLLGVTCIL